MAHVLVEAVSNDLVRLLDGHVCSKQAAQPHDCRPANCKAHDYKNQGHYSEPKGWDWDSGRMNLISKLGGHKRNREGDPKQNKRTSVMNTPFVAGHNCKDYF